MTVLVWSERNEINDPTGHVHDCAYCSIVVCLIHGGFTRFPLGAYTIAEREALERSDSRPDEEGATPSEIDEAILNRYGMVAHRPSSTATIRGVLTTPNLCVSVGGTPADAPAGSPIRKFLGAFQFGHRIAYQTSERLLFDPMAPNKSAGVPCPVDDVVAFAKRRAVRDLRWFV